MCGVGGIVSLEKDSAPLGAVSAMLAKLRHRGPDGEGSFLDSVGNAALVHTRLAILDLSAAGQQPCIQAAVAM